MATKHDEFKVYYFSFTDEELRSVVSALRVNGDDELADEICGECDDCDCGESIGVDSSDVADARYELDKLKEAVNALYEAHKGPVEYIGTIGPVDHLIKELLAGVN